MKRYGSVINVDIDINVNDVLHELHDEDILAELKRRNLSRGDRDGGLGVDDSLAEEALLALRQGRVHDATVVLERGLYPKFETLDACRAAYAKAMRRAA